MANDDRTSSMLLITASKEGYANFASGTMAQSLPFFCVYPKVNLSIIYIIVLTLHEQLTARIDARDVIARQASGIKPHLRNP